MRIGVLAERTRFAGWLAPPSLALVAMVVVAPAFACVREQPPQVHALSGQCARVRSQRRTVKLSVKLADRPTKCWYMHGFASAHARMAQACTSTACQPARQARRQSGRRQPAAAGGRLCVYTFFLLLLLLQQLCVANLTPGQSQKQQQ